MQGTTPKLEVTIAREVLPKRPKVLGIDYTKKLNLFKLPYIYIEVTIAREVLPKRPKVLGIDYTKKLNLFKLPYIYTVCMNLFCLIVQ
jgi:hypothetical protein